MNWLDPYCPNLLHPLHVGMTSLCPGRVHTRRRRHFNLCVVPRLHPSSPSQSCSTIYHYSVTTTTYLLSFNLFVYVCVVHCSILAVTSCKGSNKSSHLPHPLKGRKGLCYLSLSLFLFYTLTSSIVLMTLSDPFPNEKKKPRTLGKHIHRIMEHSNVTENPGGFVPSC